MDQEKKNKSDNININNAEKTEKEKEKGNINTTKDYSPNKLNNIESENNTDPFVTETIKADRYHRNKDGSWASP